MTTHMQTMMTDFDAWAAEMDLEESEAKIWAWLAWIAATNRVDGELDKLYIENEALRSEVSSLESSPLSEEALDILRSENEKLRAECLRLSHAEAEALAVLAGVEEREAKLRARLDWTMATIRDEPKMKTQFRVRKIGGSFQHTGTIVSSFTTLAGEPRIVVEFDPPVQGMLHIYRPDQVEPLEEPK